MSQFNLDTPIDPDTKSGTTLASDLSSWRDALHSAHKGAARPSYAIAGTVWIDDSATPWEIYVFDGTDDILLGTLDATANTFVAETKGPTIQVFTASGTYTKPAGLRAARVRVIPGGGAGGGAPATGATTASAGAGGGAGGYAEGWLDAASIGATETVTIGAGGTGVSGAQGNTGGTSSFGALLSATGGVGGLVAAAGSTINGIRGSAGGAGAGGDINATGSPGEGAWRVGTTDAGTPAAFSGNGGSSIVGGGALGVVVFGATGSSGLAASGRGAGGSGASNGSSQAAQAGGTGGDGLIIVEEVY